MLLEPGSVTESVIGWEIGLTGYGSLSEVMVGGLGIEPGAVALAALENVDKCCGLFVGNSCGNALKLLLESAKSSEDFIRVLLDDIFPQSRIAGRDAGRVPKSTSGIIAPLVGLRVEIGAKC